MFKGEKVGTNLKGLSGIWGGDTVSQVRTRLATEVKIKKLLNYNNSKVGGGGS